MAAILATVNSGEVSLVAATAKTVLQVVAAANHRVRLRRLSLFGKGTSPTDTPYKVRLVRQTTAGTMTSATPVKHDASTDETLQTTAQKNASAEPTSTDEIGFYEVHPQAGLVLMFPPDECPLIAGGARLGIEVTSAQTGTVVVDALFEE